MRLASTPRQSVEQRRPGRRPAGFTRRTSLCIALSAGLLLSGCGGYARNSASDGSIGSRSGVEVYGTIDVGVQNVRTR